ncbi:MAG: NADH:flavin oxidoreductase [Candidatus Hodarchaeales archaeon]|jgi:2,4-dienoyl-CoA reductase-like NADH-dependent reductase (Old Yellow Enzyme family)
MFNPAEIGSLKIPNHFIRSATAEFAANPDGTVIDEYYELYTNLALGEVGLIIQGHLYVMDEGKAHDKMAGIAHEYHLAGLRRIVESIHNTKTGSKVVAQLNHGGIHSVSRKAPSVLEGKKAQVMTENDIEIVIEAFGKAALKAKKVGYDAVQIHAAHGYLLSEFLTNRFNLRNDSWGGSLEGKAHLLLSVYHEVRSKLGSKFPVLVKMNNSDEPEEGFSVEEASKVANWLAEEGLDAIEISGHRSTRTKFDQEVYFSKNAQIIKKNIGDMPLAVVGGIRSLKVIEKLHREFADFVSICRPFIREPDLVQQFRGGKTKADCISCNKCFKPPVIITCLDKEKH